MLERAPNMAEAYEWSKHLKQADDFMPQAREAWCRVTDRPWNKTAMHRVLAEFAAHVAAQEQPR